MCTVQRRLRSRASSLLIECKKTHPPSRISYFVASHRPETGGDVLLLFGEPTQVHEPIAVRRLAHPIKAWRHRAWRAAFCDGLPGLAPYFFLQRHLICAKWWRGAGVSGNRAWVGAVPDTKRILCRNLKSLLQICGMRSARSDNRLSAARTRKCLIKSTLLHEESPPAEEQERWVRSALRMRSKRARGRRQGAKSSFRNGTRGPAEGAAQGLAKHKLVWVLLRIFRIAGLQYLKELLRSPDN
ncbi:hypothetical protein SAMN05444746_12741 [Variovorax sp. OK212]|nr:hypothetical protein SAMN05518853_12741 [Variovorax sp. OK202]SFE52874.1 hypothetical protein SAMN05444746_12741 [Variovorax sp. OK212]